MLFDYIGREDGLPQGQVFDILQDRRGFMWFGTMKGLVKYDGYEFTLYAHEPDDPNSLSFPTVLRILEDSGGSLWIGTQKGLTSFNRETHTRGGIFTGRTIPTAYPIITSWLFLKTPVMSCGLERRMAWTGITPLRTSLTAFCLRRTSKIQRVFRRSGSLFRCWIFAKIPAEICGRPAITACIVSIKSGTPFSFSQPVSNRILTMTPFIPSASCPLRIAYCCVRTKILSYMIRMPTWSGPSPLRRASAPIRSTNWRKTAWGTGGSPSFPTACGAMNSTGDNSLISRANRTTRPACATTGWNRFSRTISAPVILIIEDNGDVARFIASCLEHRYRPRFAKNGSAGLKKALRIVPDLIICDVLMPRKDGYQLCKALKNDERSSHIPIILLTAKADQASKIEGLSRGADAYLIKPFNERELQTRIEQLLTLRRRLQQYYLALIQRQKEPGAGLAEAFGPRFRKRNPSRRKPPNWCAGMPPIPASTSQNYAVRPA